MDRAEARYVSPISKLSVLRFPPLTGVMSKQTIPPPAGVESAQPRSVHIVRDGSAILLSYLEHGI